RFFRSVCAHYAACAGGPCALATVPEEACRRSESFSRRHRPRFPGEGRKTDRSRRSAETTRKKSSKEESGCGNAIFRRTLAGRNGEGVGGVESHRDSGLEFRAGMARGSIERRSAVPTVEGPHATRSEQSPI